MRPLAEIPVRVEAPATAPQQFGNAVPVLNEIRHALQRLREQGEPTRIDLAAMPFGPGDEERLMATLGRGEVEAQIEALGPTRIWETRFAGVWILDYANVEGERVAFQIEIDEVPQILRAQATDIADALSTLTAELDAPAEPDADTAR
jgi:hydrogenase-1 operon protein HyaF